jgi:hypothetical protein
LRRLDVALLDRRGAGPAPNNAGPGSRRRRQVDRQRWRSGTRCSTTRYGTSGCPATVGMRAVLEVRRVRGRPRRRRRPGPDRR